MKKIFILILFCVVSIDAVPQNFEKKYTKFIPSNHNTSNLNPSDIPSERVLRQMGFSEEEIKNYLSSKDLKMSKIETRFGAEGCGPSVYVEDPEGNSIELKGVERS